MGSGPTKIISENAMLCDPLKNVLGKKKEMQQIELS